MATGVDTTLGEGFRVGHWTDAQALTGCTVVLPPLGNVTSCDIRGSSPSTRELAHLDVDRKLTEVHAILLTGGSAFGLSAATGIMAWLEERDVGYRTPIGPIPIVPTAVIFDLAAGRPDIRPGPDDGRAACDNATQAGFPTGRIGAGAGATVGKWAGIEHRALGGLGIGSASAGQTTVSALAVVNAVGDVLAADGTTLAGTSAPVAEWQLAPGDPAITTNTVLVVVCTQAAMDKRDVRWLAARGSDGVTKAVRPAHTRYDGDVTFAIAAPPGPDAPPVTLDVLGHLATEAVSAAIRNAVS